MNTDRFKFRVWDNIINRYRKEGTIQLSGNGQPFIINGDMQPEDIDDVVIEQCTCLRDRNGNLIYEGDFVKVVGGGMFEHGMTFEIVDGISRWQIRNCGNYKHYNKYHDLDIGSMFEIIGNVHEMEVPQ